MDIGTINRATRNLGAPVDWDPARHGTCGGLPIRDEEHAPGLSRMVSAWFPTPDEIALLQSGSPILLYVIGERHPPVAMGVGVTAKEASR